MSKQHGAVCWSELLTRKPDVAKGYYRAVCGWSWDTAKVQDGQDYVVARSDGKPVAGLSTAKGALAAAGEGWLTYIAVADVDAAASATEERGGTVLRAPSEVPGVGRLAIVEDTAGAMVGIMTPERRAG